MTLGDWPGEVGWLDIMYGMHSEGSSYLDQVGTGDLWTYPARRLWCGWKEGMFLGDEIIGEMNDMEVVHLGSDKEREQYQRGHG